MNLLEKYYLTHDIKRYGLKPALRINVYRVTKDDLREIPLAEMFPLTIDFAEAKFSRLRMYIFEIFLEHIRDKTLDKIAQEYLLSESYIPKNEHYKPVALLMSALEIKLGDNRKQWQKAADLFSVHKELSKLLEEKMQQLEPSVLKNQKAL